MLQHQIYYETIRQLNHLKIEIPEKQALVKDLERKIKLYERTTKKDETIFMHNRQGIEAESEARKHLPLGFIL